MHKVVLVSLACLVFLANGCVTYERPIPTEPLTEPGWRPLFQGVDYFEHHRVAPYPIAIHALRIDLRAKGISFLVTPSNDDRPLDTDGLLTSTFLKKYGLQSAINGSYFEPVEQIEGAPKDIIELSMSRGDLYSPHEGHEDFEDHFYALLITKDNRARFDDPPVEIRDAYNAIGGSFPLVKQGENEALKNEDARCVTRNPFTAVGLSRDEHTMYWLVIDGRQEDYSGGATVVETADWLLWLGAYSGILLDGGGSTTMVMEDATGNPKVLNRPIHDGVPGTERVNGNHIGLYALPLD